MFILWKRVTWCDILLGPRSDNHRNKIYAILSQSSARSNILQKTSNKPRESYISPTFFLKNCGLITIAKITSGHSIIADGWNKSCFFLCFHRPLTLRFLRSDKIGNRFGLCWQWIRQLCILFLAIFIICCIIMIIIQKTITNCVTVYVVNLDLRSLHDNRTHPLS